MKLQTLARPIETPPGRPGEPPTEHLLTRKVAILFGSNLVSCAAYALLNLALSNRVYQLTGAATLAASVFVVAYLPSLCCGHLLGAFIDRNLSRRTLLACEALAALVGIGGGLLLMNAAPLWILLALLAIRSILNAAVRTSVSKWLKLISPPVVQRRRRLLLQVCVLLALTLSGIAVGAASRAGAAFIPFVLVAGIGLSATSLGLIGLLGPGPRPPGIETGWEDRAGELPGDGGWWSTYRAILQDKRLARHFLVICLGQGMFQASELVIVSVHGGDLASDGAGVAWLQIAASLGLLTGFALLWCLPRILADRPTRIGGAMIFGLSAFVIATQASSVIWVLPAFLAMTAAYELIDSNSTSLFFEASPADQTARYDVAMTVLSGTGMSLAVLTYGLLIDVLGFSDGSLAFLGLCVVITLALTLGFRPRSRGGR